MDDYKPVPIETLRTYWDSLSQTEQDEYSEDCALAVIESHCDASDHMFHRILG